MKKSLIMGAVFAFSLLISCYPVAHAASFTPLGDLSGGIYNSQAYDISADGAVVVGMSQSSNNAVTTNEAIRWTIAEGMTGLGFIQSGATFSSAYGASANGSILVGTSELTGLLGNEAFSWTGAEGMTGIGSLGGVNVNGLTDGIASSTSADGSVIVGRSESLSGSEAFRWTESTGMVGLSDLEGGVFFSEATDVSADGDITVGLSRNSSGMEAFLWTMTNGMVGLGTLDGDTESGAHGISADGTTIAGWSANDDLSRVEAFRWTETEGMVGLGDLFGGDFHSLASDLSADASVIVGRARSDLGDFAFLWDEANGMQNLQDLLINEHGLDLSGWSLIDATAVSADGLKIVGNGINPDGLSEAWYVNLASVPIPSPLAIRLRPVGADRDSEKKESRLTDG